MYKVPAFTRKLIKTRVKYRLVDTLVSHTKGGKLNVFENRVLRRIFGPKREEVAVGWRRLHNEEIYSMYVSANILRVMK
jgi:hypothetical protein